MTIETKFDIDQTVYLLFNNKIVSSEIEDIHITFPRNIYTSERETKYSYRLYYKDTDGGLKIFWHPEEDLFPSKEELLKSL